MEFQENKMHASVRLLRVRHVHFCPLDQIQCNSVNVAAETKRRRYVDAQANFTKRGLPKKINTSAGNG